VGLISMLHILAMGIGKVENYDHEWDTDHSQ